MSHLLDCHPGRLTSGREERTYCGMLVSKSERFLSWGGGGLESGLRSRQIGSGLRSHQIGRDFESGPASLRCGGVWRLSLGVSRQYLDVSWHC